MRKLLALITISLSLAVFLSACGTVNNPASTTAPVAENPATTPTTPTTTPVPAPVAAPVATPETTPVTTPETTPVATSDYVLSAITLSSGILSPAFDSSTTSYTASVSNSITGVTVAPTAIGSGGTITVNGSTVASGSTSSSVALSVGDNSITIVVTKADNTTKTYTITVTRAAAVYTISSIALSSGTLSPSFSSGTTSYTASVANAVSSITVTPTATGDEGIITVNGLAVTSGNASASIALSVGSNTITVVITPTGGSATTYTITVTRAASGSVNTTAPASTVKLVFVHHSIGENWLADSDGGLGIALRDNNYFVSDTNYYWGPTGNLSLGIGTYTDIGYWYNWFRDTYSSTYLTALYAENQKNNLTYDYSRLATEPVGDNEVIVFKSGHMDSNLQGNTSEAVPAIGSNPLRGQYYMEGNHTVANAKGIYIELLNYFSTRQDKLFIVITAPPVTDGTYADNARYFNNWLVNDWLDSYAYNNVAVFDFYNVLTHPDNHHRINGGVVVHEINNSQNISYYPGGVGGGDHINSAGGQKAATEFLPLLNYYYNTWKGN